MKTNLKNQLLHRVSLLGKSLQTTTAVSLIALSTAHAATIDWAPPAAPTGTVTWATGTNWTGNVAPVSDLVTDIARFNQTAYNVAPTATSNGSINGLIIGDGSTVTPTLVMTTGSGNSRLNIGAGGIVMNANSGAFSIGFSGSQGAAIVASQTWQNNSSSLLTMNSIGVDNGSAANPVLTLSGSGSGGFTSANNITNSASPGTGIFSLIINLSGSGVAALSAGGSTYTGGTTLTAGTVLLGDNATLGTGPFTINGGTVTTTKNTLVTANPQFWNSDWTFGGGFNWGTGASTVTLGGNVKVTTSGVGIPNVNSVITGTGNLTKAGSGTLTLSNSSSYIGKTIVNEGTLTLDFGNTSVATSSGDQSNKAPATSPLEVGGGTVTVSGGSNRPAWAVVAPTAWTSSVVGTPVTRFTLTFATLPAVAIGQPVTGTGFLGGIVQAINTTSNTVTIDTTSGTPAAGGGSDFAASATTASWTAMATTGLPAGQYSLTFATAPAVTPGQTVTATGLTGAYVVRISGQSIIVASSTAPAATGTNFALVTFNPSSAQTFASTALTSSASTITPSLGSGTGVKLNLGAITRAVGTTVQLNNPGGILSATNGILTSTGSTSTALLDSGVAYATAGANNWAAKDATNTWIESASINLNDATLLGSPNSATTTLIDTVLAADSSPATMKCNLAESRTITATGFTITTGGVLVGSNVTATNGLTITGGTLKSAANVANKDLVVINNGAGSLTINSTITNSAAGSTGLTKSGTGTVKLGGYNSYSGNTIINKGTLSLTATNTLANASGVVIGSDSTAILNLNFVGTEYVAALTINGVVKADGNYTSSDPSGRITGGGTLTVGGTPPASPYDTWAAIYLPADVSNPAGDNDNDGLANQQEFAYGLNPLSGSSVNPILVQLDQTTGQFSYQRRSGTGLTYTILKSTTLAAGSWSSASASQAAGAVDGNGNQTVVVTLPGAPLTEAKLFVRVSAE